MMFKKVLMIYKNEGVFSVIKSVFHYLFQNILSYETYYLLKIHVKDSQIKQKKPVDFADKLTFKWIESNVEANELSKEFEDFRSYTTKAHHILDAGGTAICIYVGKEVASTAWLATSKTAMKTMTDLPVHVDFNNKEVYSGYSYTIPKYRRSGLRYYRLRFRYKMFTEKGFEILCSAIRTNNYVSLKANSDRPAHTVTAKVHILKILGLRFWKEYPVNITFTDVLDKMPGKKQREGNHVV